MASHVAHFGLPVPVERMVGTDAVKDQTMMMYTSAQANLNQPIP